MPNATARRRFAVVLAAALTAAAMIAISVATAAPSRTLYRNFCPVTPGQVHAAGPYTVISDTAS
jgi:hypothetical protein